MALVIMCHCARPVWRERQAKLRGFPRLARALFVAAKHERVGGRIEIEPDNVPEFGLKIWIVRELKDLDDVRFELALRPDPLHRAVRDADVATHAAHAPAVPVLGRTRDLSAHVRSVASFATDQTVPF